jgi:regulator of PEP synthase PpsR (kinase-PPPase family)
MVPEPRFIDVLSDSTGDTAERVIRAALLQFPQAGVKIRVHSSIRTKATAQPVIEKAAADESLLVFSVVSPELSAFIHAATAELKVSAVDVIGALIGRLQAFLARQPINRPGSELPLSEEYFRRVEAVEFTVRADAGRDPKSFLKADLILVGVSRTSKTPLATLLAQRGLKVANLTVVLNTKPLPELYACPQDRVIALTIDVESLCEIRQQRLRKLGMPPESRYALEEHVAEELAFAEKLFSDNPKWRIVEMTGRTVEETASIILNKLRD